MGERKDALQRKIQYCQKWAEFAESNYWKNLVKPYLTAKRDEAETAFHKELIDDKSNEIVLRHFLSQRTKVSTVNEVINEIESAMSQKRILEADLARIDKEEAKHRKKDD